MVVILLKVIVTIMTQYFIVLNLRANRLRLFRYLSAIILNYLNQFRKSSNVNKYGKIVYDLALRRYLIEIGEKIATNTYSSTLADTAISQIDSLFKKLTN
ncbi:DNA helicase [Orientia tsutsugamushi]|nr:DNA helicase [Orientia tsutsugamushi]